MRGNAVDISTRVPNDCTNLYSAAGDKICRFLKPPSISKHTCHFIFDILLVFSSIQYAFLQRPVAFHTSSICVSFSKQAFCLSSSFSGFFYPCLTIVQTQVFFHKEFSLLCGTSGNCKQAFS